MQTNHETNQPNNKNNGQKTSIIDGGQQQNIEIISAVGFIEQTMQTRKSFGGQLEIQLDTDLTQ